MENYVSAELEIVAIASQDTISISIEIELGEDELPVDRFYNF